MRRVGLPYTPLLLYLRHVDFLQQALRGQEGLPDASSIGRYVLSAPIALRIEVGSVSLDN
jgi:hypothetical protein